MDSSPKNHQNLGFHPINEHWSCWVWCREQHWFHPNHCPCMDGISPSKKTHPWGLICSNIMTSWFVLLQRNDVPTKAIKTPWLGLWVIFIIYHISCTYRFVIYIYIYQYMIVVWLYQSIDVHHISCIIYLYEYIYVHLLNNICILTKQLIIIW